MKIESEKILLIIESCRVGINYLESNDLIVKQIAFNNALDEVKRSITQYTDGDISEEYLTNLADRLKG